MNEKTMLTPVELAVRWGVTESALQKWRSKGIGPRHMKVNTRVRYPIKDVIEYEERQTATREDIA